MQQYNLYENIHNGYLYIEICKRVYGLSQAGIIDHTQLK